MGFKLSVRISIRCFYKLRSHNDWSYSIPKASMKLKTFPFAL